MSNTATHPLLQAILQSQPEKTEDVYANSLRMGATINDFVVFFGISLDAPGGGAAQKDLATIRLAPRTAKSLMMNLTAAIEAYEEVLGEIRMPESSVGDFDLVKSSIVSVYRSLMSAKTGIASVTRSDGP